MRRTRQSFAVFLLLLGSACSGDSRTPGADTAASPASAGGDGGGELNPGSQAEGTDAQGATPGVATDASSATGSADAAAPELVDQVVEYLTCKPEELNPIVDCLTVQCPMQADPVALATCLADDCTKLVEAVSPKCRDCVIAGVAQDTAGLVEDCLDTRAILGDAGTANPLPF